MSKRLTIVITAMVLAFVCAGCAELSQLFQALEAVAGEGGDADISSGALWGGTYREANNPGNVANGGLVCYDGADTYLCAGGMLALFEDEKLTSLYDAPFAHMNDARGAVFGAEMDDPGLMAREGFAFPGGLWAYDKASGEAQPILPDKGHSYLASGGYVYYIADAGAYRASLDGDGETALLFSGNVGEIALYEGKLYLTATAQGGMLYCVDASASASEPEVCGVRCGMLIGYEDGLYYIDRDAYDRVGRLTAEGNELIAQTAALESVSCFLLEGGWMYYVADGKPCAAPLSGGEPEVLEDGVHAAAVFVDDEYVFFRIMDDQNEYAYYPLIKSVLPTKAAQPTAPPKPPDIPKKKDDYRDPPKPAKDEMFDAPAQAGICDILSGTYEGEADVLMGGVEIPLGLAFRLYIQLNPDGTGIVISEGTYAEDFGMELGGETEIEFAYLDGVLYMRDPRNATGETGNMNDVDYYVYSEDGRIHLTGIALDDSDMGYRLTVTRTGPFARP